MKMSGVIYSGKIPMNYTVGFYGIARVLFLINGGTPMTMPQIGYRLSQ
jgi:hypothetical protein